MEVERLKPTDGTPDHRLKRGKLTTSLLGHSFTTCAGYNDNRSIVIATHVESYQRFLRGERVAIETLEQDSSESVFENGPCLVAACDFLVPDHNWGQPTFTKSDRDFAVEALLDNLWLADCSHGEVRRSADQSVRQTLLALDSAVEIDVPVIPMSAVEHFTCAHEMRSLMQAPGAYKELYDTGSYHGILNHAACHLACGADIVWIEEDLCHVWIRAGNTTGNIDWLRLVPFRIERSGGSGRLLKSCRPRSFLGAAVASVLRLREPYRGYRTTWYHR